MDNKFIVFVVFAAVVPLAWASGESSDVDTAREASRTAWRQVAEIVCKSIQNESWPLEDAREEYRATVVEGGIAFRSVAPRSDNPIVVIEATAFSTAFRDAIFRGIRDARKCGDLATTLAAIEDLKEQLPYDGLADRFHQMTEDTGSVTPAVNALKEVYEGLFNEIQKLAVSVSEGGAAIDACAIEEIHEKVDVEVGIIYGWLEQCE